MVTEEELAREKERLCATGEEGALVWRRAHHVVTENARTEQAACALRDGSTASLERLGVLMLASHRSLQLDYEVPFTFTFEHSYSIYASYRQTFLTTFLYTFHLV